MSDLVDRITAVLREHKPTTRRKPSKRAGFIDVVTACKGCDWTGSTLNEDLHPAHVAERVAAELQLTEETRYQFTHTASGRSTILELADMEQAQAIERRDKMHTLAPVRRWVSAYEETKEEK